MMTSVKVTLWLAVVFLLESPFQEPKLSVKGDCAIEGPGYMFNSNYNYDYPFSGDASACCDSCAGKSSCKAWTLGDNYPAGKACFYFNSEPLTGPVETSSSHNFVHGVKETGGADPCDSSPCKNGGTCHSSGSSFTCDCVRDIRPGGWVFYDWAGSTCEIKKFWDVRIPDGEESGRDLVKCWSSSTCNPDHTADWFCQQRGTSGAASGLHQAEWIRGPSRYGDNFAECDQQNQCNGGERWKTIYCYP